MKAIRVAEFGGPEVLKLATSLPIPNPKKGEVVIRVHYAGVNPVDTYIRTGKYSRVPTLPYTPGSDCAGEILSLPEGEDSGSGSHNLRVGQRVFTSSTLSGSYASHTVAPVGHVHNLPDKVTFVQGAALGVPYFTAYRALVTKGKLKSTDTVLIHGASGAVGTACCHIASHIGAKVLGTAGTEEGEKLAMANGAVATFNHREPSHVQKILKWTENRGVNVIVEMLADKNLNEDCEMSASNGIILVVGSRGTLKFDPRATMTKEVRVQGVALAHSTPEDWKEAGHYLSELLEKGVARPVVGKEFPLGEAAKAHHEIIHNEGSHGKIVLKCD